MILYSPWLRLEKGECGFWRSGTDDWICPSGIKTAYHGVGGDDCIRVVAETILPQSCCPEPDHSSDIVIRILDPEISGFVGYRTGPYTYIHPHLTCQLEDFYARFYREGHSIVVMWIEIECPEEGG